MRRMFVGALTWVLAVAFQVTDFPKDPLFVFAVWTAAAAISFGLLATWEPFRRRIRRYRARPMLIIAVSALLGAVVFGAIGRITLTKSAEQPSASATEPRQLESNFTIGIDEVKVTRVQEEAVGTVDQPFPPSPPPVPLVALVVRLTNTGDPSIAERFALWFNPSRGGPVVTGEYRRVPDGMELDRSDVVYAVDDLAEKAFTRIDTGAAVRGRLLFVFPMVERAAFDVIGATLTLEFFDAWDRKYGAVITRTGSGNGYAIQQLPGLRR